MRDIVFGIGEVPADLIMKGEADIECRKDFPKDCDTAYMYVGAQIPGRFDDIWERKVYPTGFVGWFQPGELIDGRKMKFRKFMEYLEGLEFIPSVSFSMLMLYAMLDEDCNVREDPSCGLWGIPIVSVGTAVPPPGSPTPEAGEWVYL